MPTELPPPIDSQEAAQNWLDELVTNLEYKRFKCDILVPGDAETQAKQQRKDYHSYLLHHGQVLGVAMSLLRCGMISTVQYNSTCSRVRETLVPSKVGEVKK